MIHYGPLQRRILWAAWRHRRRPAVSGPGCEPLNHYGLVRRALRWAWRLEAHRDRLDGPVALWYPKNTDLVAAMTGVVLAGGTFLCLDPSREEPDRAGFFRRMRVRLMLCRTRPPEDVAAVPGLLWLGDDAVAPVPLWRGDWRPGPGSEVCSVVRTSGTTGAPRGVRQTAAGMLHHAEALAELEGIGPASRLSWVSPPGLAAAHSHLFASLLTGACLCPFHPQREGLDAMTRWMRDQRITHLHCTPSLLRAWLGSLPPGSLFPDLHSIKLGGETARAADAALVVEKLAPAPRLLNGLGMSEACGNIAWGPVNGSSPAGGPLLPVGRPVRDRSVRLMAGPDREAAEGEPGEIVVADRWISPGYWPPEEESAGVFRTGRGGRELWTGDLGRWDAKGHLVHLGRKDRRIRVRGRGVDLAEVEARVASVDGVRQVAAVAEETGTAYRLALVLAEDHESARQQIRRRLAEELPVGPARTAFFETLPMGETGKRQDREILRMWPDENRSAAWAPEQEPVRALWREILGHEGFGPDESFLHAGGDSLGIMQIAAGLSKLAGRVVGVSAVLWHDTVTKQARALASGELGQEEPGRGSGATRYAVWWERTREGGAEGPICIHPGGWMSEAEMWLAHGLMSEVEKTRSCWVARSTIGEDAVPGPSTWDEAVADLREAPGPGAVLVGLSVGAPVVLDVARGWPGARVILLDPWTPGLPSGLAAAGIRNQPDRVVRYYDLLKSNGVDGWAGRIDVLLAADDPHVGLRRDFWEIRATTCALTPGTHQTFVREYRADTARALARLLSMP